MNQDKLWMQLVDEKGKPCKSVFDRIRVMPDPSTPGEFPTYTTQENLDEGLIAFRQVLPYQEPDDYDIDEGDEGDGEDEGEEAEEAGEEPDEEFEMEVDEELEELKVTQVPNVQQDVEEPEEKEAGDVSEEEMAECFECSAVIPISAPICPHCGAVFE